MEYFQLAVKIRVG